MKVLITEDYGFAGTDTSYEEEIPENIVEAGEEAISGYIAELEQSIWENMLSQLVCTVELVEEEDE